VQRERARARAREQGGWVGGGGVEKAPHRSFRLRCAGCGVCKQTSGITVDGMVSRVNACNPSTQPYIVLWAEGVCVARVCATHNTTHTTLAGWCTLCLSAPPLSLMKTGSPAASDSLTYANCGVHQTNWGIFLAEVEFAE
jgi:hypothetical protein